MLQKLDHRLGHYSLLILVSGLLFFVNLGGASLWDVDEGRNATCAYEMLESGDWVVPTFNAELRVDKPALLYWLQMAAYRVFGVEEFAARLPSALAALLAVLLTYELARSMFDRSTALLSGLIAASSVMLCAAAHFANPDALLNVCTVLTLFLLWHCIRTTGRYPFFLAGLAAGLGMLAKGPVGLVLPLAVIGPYLLWTRQLRLMWSPRLLLGTLSFSVVSLPWYILVGAETKGAFLRGFFLRHNVDRFLQPMEDHTGGAWYYPLVLLIGFAPWSIFLALTLWYGFWSALQTPWQRVQHWWTTARDTEEESSSPHLPSEQRYRFLWCWLLVYVLFFSLAATKLPNYILPICTPLAILTARMLDRYRRGLIQPPGWIMGISLTCLALIGVGTSAGLAIAGGLISLPSSLPAFPTLGVWAGLGVVPLLGAAVAWWYQRLQQRTGVIVSVAVASVVFLVPLAAWVAGALNAVKPSRPLVAQSDTRDPSTDLRIGGYQIEHLPSLNFYCQRTINHFVRERELLDFLQYRVPVYLFLPETAWQQLQAQVKTPHRLIARQPDLYKGGWVVVITNQ